jgi:SAM-dependent methyltransferase
MWGGKKVLASPEVSRVISPLDTMLDKGQEEAYFSVGKGALEHCKTALRGRTPKRVLDFPSGYGRAMRWFAHEWPEAELFASELDSRCLDFLEKNFGARRVQAHDRLDMKIPGNMDLIFSGSLLTHFDEWQWDIYLPMCASALSEDGVFVFTTHGRIAALLAQDRHPVYGTLVDTADLYERYLETGFAFSPYDANYPTFGLSLSSPEWIMRRLQKMPGIKVIGFEEGGWGQDIWTVQRNPWPMIK